MNLYVSNLDRNVTEEELKKLFQQYGEVSSVKVITDYNTGYSRGFAFVDIPNDQEAAKAIKKLDNTEISGRPLSVQVARPKEEKSKKGFYPERDGYKRY